MPALHSDIVHCTVAARRSRRGLWFALLFLLCLLPASAQEDAVEFRYRFVEGELWRGVTSIQQDVFLDGRFSHSARIFNRAAGEVLEAGPDGGLTRMTYAISEEISGSNGSFELSEEHQSEIRQDSTGHVTVGDAFAFPTVRNIPTFPDRPVRPGESWTGTGEEVHDFTRDFGLQELVRFEFPVNYTYEGPVEIEGRTYDLIHVRYNAFFSPDRPLSAGVYPQLIAGSIQQRLYWDRLRSRIGFYDDEFEFLFTLNTGRSVRIEGTSEGEILESSVLDRDLVVAEVSRELEDRGVEVQSVRSDELGVTIALDSIQFPPDSAFLAPSERGKLEQIAEILLRYPERDILISGHTALAGTAEGRLQLSQQRAAAVAEYLISLGVRAPERMISRGFGASRPVGDNSIESGRRLNRRVEITILEN